MRLTDQQIRSCKNNLSQWRSLHGMSVIAEELMDKLGITDLFSQPGVEFVREAWIAGYFGKARDARFVRLINEERPDFAMQFSNGDTENYELVEAGTLGRKRGSEYKQAASNRQPPRDVSIEQWATSQVALEVIQAAVRIKIKRAEELQRQQIPYPLGTRLLVYLNIGNSGVHQHGIESVFSQAVKPARRWFSSIWIFWQMRAYEI